MEQLDSQSPRRKHRSRMFFDIETGPLEESQLKEIMPVFEPAANLRDPDKIAADLERKRQRWLSDAALSAMTGRVLAIGIAYDNDPVEIIDDEAEELMLCRFWRCVIDNPSSMVLCGFCIGSFDLPFLFQRSWRHSLVPPLYLLRLHRYWAERVLDLRELWCLGQRDMGGSLADVARHLRLPPKLGTGDKFHELWRNDRPKALEYLVRDIEITRALAERIGNRIRD